MRALAQHEAPPPPAPADADEVALEVDGAVWAVRVLGRSGGSGSARVPMLLLGFWGEGAAEGEPRLESLVVGRTLEGLSTSDLEKAFRAGRAPRPPHEGTRSSEPRARGRRGSAGRRRGS